MPSMESLITGFYVSMTSAKVAQLILHWLGNSLNKRRAKPDRIAYRPSMQAAVTMINFIANQDVGVEAIPRKEYQQITDPMLQQYMRKYPNQQPKTFSSLEAAKRSFFQEFTGEFDRTTWFLCRSIAYLATAQIAAPLGLLWFIYVVPWFLLSAIALVHEKFFLGGDVLTWVIHVAVAVTITDVYVVCCKEDISFEQGIYKYKWLDFFSREQIHPLIATRVCPMYNKKIQFRPDIMDFEFDLVPHRNAMITLHERRPSSRPLQLLALACALLSLYVFSSHHDTAVSLLFRTFWPSIQRIAPSASLFYAVRLLVDCTMGTSWDCWWAL